MRRDQYKGYREHGHGRLYSLAVALGLVFDWKTNHEINHGDRSVTRGFTLTRVTRWVFRAEVTR